MTSETQEQAAFTGTTHIGVVLDKSGSMGRVRRETIGGFNAWLKDQQELPDQALLTLALFDTAYSVPIVATDITKVNPLDESRYMPSGSTALFRCLTQQPYGPLLMQKALPATRTPFGRSLKPGT